MLPQTIPDFILIAPARRGMPPRCILKPRWLDEAEPQWQEEEQLEAAPASTLH
ncbi:hypothetical protein IGB42_04212 [Andreprevotia sp. IGB-42]|uniref:hypothetical protein n=1 Tax=Andreprevotia sp. IGB-42 TaxID=2497473 RepID=UPI0013573B8E|nr:hypothetical protein [Andreprevotia sp. IGB-42]KAF0811317.1 hypothetical protein IGB42_04212 [Andreprevotia sp. IGB-42]